MRTSMPWRAFVVYAGLAIALAAGAVHAADPADFSGTWVFNKKKGQNLPMGGMMKETLTIVQGSGKVTVDSKSSFMGMGRDYRVVYDLSGKPVKNAAAMGDKGETTSKWDGAKLVTVWTMESAVPSAKNIKTETRTLSADGKSMSVATARAGKPTMELVYDKQ